jgi:hypothetical protein
MYYSKLIDRELLPNKVSPDKLSPKIIKPKKEINVLNNTRTTAEWCMFFFFSLISIYAIYKFYNYISELPTENSDFSFLPANMQNSDYVRKLKGENEEIMNSEVIPFE